MSKNRKWCHDLKIAYGVKGLTLLEEFIDYMWLIIFLFLPQCLVENRPKIKIAVHLFV